MKAIILAAGRGSRMGDLTARLPKCRTVLHGKELIQWQLDSLRGGGVGEIAIVRGYLAETFDFNLTYFENKRWAETNMIMSLIAAKDWLDSGTCITSYSDIVYSVDAVNVLKKASGDIVITYDPNWEGLWSMRFEDPLSDAETFKLEGDKVVEIGNQASSTTDIEGQYMGLVKFTPSGWRYVWDYLSQFNQAEKDSMDMTMLLKGLIASGIKVQAKPINDRWFEVDSCVDLELYSRLPIL